jgi:hypothetical protein
MPTITFFRQARRDGGIRTGIDIDNQTVLSCFEGAEEDDPALVWFVDVRCSGQRLPRDVEEARRWLERHEAQIAGVLEALAKRLPEGLDPSEWPLKLTKRLTGQVSVTVACSAVRRVEARKLDQILRDIAKHWSDRLKSLDVVQVA